VEQPGEKVNVGLLLFHDPALNLADNVRWAARRYKRKFGRPANVCHVHPDMVEEGTRVGGVEVRGDGTVLWLHLWVGEEDNVNQDEA
jgi:hypothetical protein